MNEKVLRLRGAAWEHIGEEGWHAGHHLAADDMQDVYCCDCGEWLDDDAADVAWPVDSQRLSKKGAEKMNDTEIFKDDLLPGSAD